jgi:hypothetical protein
MSATKPPLRGLNRSLILLTATPHDGYRHSFRSFLEVIVQSVDTTTRTASR